MKTIASVVSMIDFRELCNDIIVWTLGTIYVVVCLPLILLL